MLGILAADAIDDDLQINGKIYCRDARGSELDMGRRLADSHRRWRGRGREVEVTSAVLADDFVGSVGQAGDTDLRPS